MAIQEVDQQVKPIMPQSLIAPRRLTHSNYFVADWNKSMDFYTNVVGLNEAYRRPPLKAGFICNGNTHHDVAVMEFSTRYWPEKDADHIGLFHVAFEMEHDVALCLWYDRAVEHDVNFTVIEDHGNTHSTYMYDPDGNQIEVYVDTLKEWWRLKHGTFYWQNPDWKPWTPWPDTERNVVEDPEFTRVDAAVFHPLKTTAGAFVTRDWDAMYFFYTEVVGLQPLAGGADADWAVLTGTLGERTLGLFRDKRGLTPGFHHVSMCMADEAELDASKARAQDAAIDLIVDVDHPSRRSLAINDLDGNLLHFYHDRDNTEVDWASVTAEEALYLV